MATATLSHPAPDPVQPRLPTSRLQRALGHPLAYLGTAAILLTLFGWTFFTNPQRVAPTKDPAYYTWRAEALMTEKPSALLTVTGPFSLFSGGYRVSSAVLGSYLRRIAAVSQLKQTVFLVVALPVLIALLLGGFALQQRGDPLIFHVVALGSASLLLTPPFIGYLDNMLCLFFLAGALWFISPARHSWPARAGLGLFLIASGFTHPTTLVIFCFALAAMAVVRLILSGFDLRRTLSTEGPVLAVAFAGLLIMYASWKIGIWGRSASLSEAALAPPYGSGFFRARLSQWVRTMHPLLNGPLFGFGVIGLLAAGRKAADDILARVAILWLIPLIGVFGFLAGFTYPYYRFFNTSLAWVLLIGLGAYFAIRLFAGFARRGGVARLALLGVLAVAVIIGSNFHSGLGASGWNDPAGGWMSSNERQDLDAVRHYLSRLGQPGRPVVFVVDNKPPAPFEIYGFSKLTGNTTRYGLPPGQIDEGYLYLGSLANFAQSRPTIIGDSTYDKLSRGFLADTQRGIAASGMQPLVVMDTAFNASGANSGWSATDQPPPGMATDLVTVDHGRVTRPGGQSGPATVASAAAASSDPPRAPLWHVLVVALGLLLLLVPGLLAVAWFAPDASFAQRLGLVPALSAALLALTGIVILAIVRSPFSGVIPWLCLAVTTLLSALLWARSRSSLPRGRFTYGSSLS
ncbi:MAG: hypothetical protein QOH48_547 [Actinomycetota bacterium]|jgi:hypothetical protein|nr:hypothetical protein [Actinomycetota bacterium]